MTRAEPIYLGIENEFQLFDDKQSVDFSNYFSDLVSKYPAPYFEKGHTAIRTRQGSALYCDIEVAEVCTPPLQLDKGVAKKTVDLLYLARKELTRFIASNRELSLIGHSVHYNITAEAVESNNKKAMMALAVPYQLFCMNPSSRGLKFRESKSGKCFEITSDYLFEEEQMMAFLNLFIGTAPYIHEKSEKLPFVLPGENVEADYDGDALCLNMVLKGRNSKIDVLYPDEPRSFVDRVLSRSKKIMKSITAQEYLETYYELFQKEIAHFASPPEVRNLESFIFGRNELEADKSQKYSLYQRKKSHGWLSYDNSFVLPVDHFSCERKLPGKIARNLSRMTRPVESSVNTKGVEATFPFEINELGWNEVVLKYERNNIYLEGIHSFEIMENIMQSSKEQSWPRLIKKFAMLSQDKSLSELQEYATKLLERDNQWIKNKNLMDQFRETGIIDKRFRLTYDGVKIANAILRFEVTSKLLENDEIENQ